MFIRANINLNKLDYNLKFIERVKDQNKVKNFSKSAGKMTDVKFPTTQ